MQAMQRSPVRTGRDIGLLFKPELIRSLIRTEDPKTQTRRIISPQPVREDGFWVWKREGKASTPLVDSPLMLSKAPYQVGDHIYAKESLYLAKEPRHLGEGNCWYYTADDAIVEVEKRYEGDMLCWAHHKTNEKHSAIFMPKFAARIWRTITDVRAQRISEISEEDAIAEGLNFTYLNASHADSDIKTFEDYLAVDPYFAFKFSDPRDSFRSLWNSINGKWTQVREKEGVSYYQCYPWSEEDTPAKPLNAIRKGIPCIATPNPWVWCLTLSQYPGTEV